MSGRLLANSSWNSPLDKLCGKNLCEGGNRWVCRRLAALEAWKIETKHIMKNHARMRSSVSP